MLVELEWVLIEDLFTPYDKISKYIVLCFLELFCPSLLRGPCLRSVTVPKPPQPQHSPTNPYDARSFQKCLGLQLRGLSVNLKPWGVHCEVVELKSKPRKPSSYGAEDSKVLCPQASETITLESLCAFGFSF